VDQWHQAYWAAFVDCQSKGVMPAIAEIYVVLWSLSRWSLVVRANRNGRDGRNGI
jgi:hypothetical protein